MTAVFLNPARFTWLDRLPAPRMPRLRKRGQHHADTLTIPPSPAPGWAGPKHAGTGRISLGGLPRGPLPRRDAGAAVHGHLIDRGPGKPPFLTGEMAVLAGECTPCVPAQTNADTLAMYRGDWGVKPQLEAERLAKGLIALWRSALKPPSTSSPCGPRTSQTTLTPPCGASR